MSDIFDFPELDKLSDECPYETKLAVVRWAMKHIVRHASEGGSYRYLIYDRLGFELDAYAALLDDGMIISNEFDIDRINEIKKIVVRDRIHSLKRPLTLCDDVECFKVASCFVNGSMHCFEHANWDKKNDDSDRGH